MTDRPIIFSAPMVRALLDGRKTQTRRLIKPKPYNAAGDTVNIELARTASFERGSDGRFYYQFDHPRGGPLTGYVAGYAPGDRLYVREAFKPLESDAVWYRADGEMPEEYGQWRPSIHMPRWASRLTLTVTDVRVQRLHDISEEDALAEGVRQVAGFFQIDKPDGMTAGGTSAKAAFTLLWNSIHGPASWDANPWVVAVRFTIERRNIDQEPQQ